MSHILVDIFSEMTHLNTEEISAIENSFPLETFSKGSFLLKEGQIAKDAYFVVKGCIRSYELNKDEERTLDFYTENQSAINFSSMSSGKASNLNFVCAEETTVTIINSEIETKLYKQFPRFETFCREGMEQMMGNQQEELYKFLKLNPEERYQNLLENRADLIHRVPQYQIASYLGMKPETLSRIRARLAEKTRQ